MVELYFQSFFDFKTLIWPSMKCLIQQYSDHPNQRPLSTNQDRQERGRTSRGGWPLIEIGVHKHHHQCCQPSTVNICKDAFTRYVYLQLELGWDVSLKGGVVEVGGCSKAAPRVSVYGLMVEFMMAMKHNAVSGAMSVKISTNDTTDDDDDTQR